MSKLGKKLIAAAKGEPVGAWSTKELSPDSFLIEANIIDVGRIVIGSIKEKRGRWHVEIMWTGPGGDYKANFAEYVQALAYIQGVCDATERLV